MARAAKAIKTTRPAVKGRKPGRPPNVALDVPAKLTQPKTAKRSAAVAAPAEKRKPGRPAKTLTALPQKPNMARANAKEPAALPAAKVSKDELRSQVEKLEQLVGTLRAKSRETNKAAKQAAARIAELEAQVAQLEQAAAAAPDAPSRPTKPPRAKRQGREIDPGDAVPPGVSVQEPAPLDEEAETALENLEEHLGRG